MEISGIFLSCKTQILKPYNYENEKTIVVIYCSLSFSKVIDEHFIYINTLRTALNDDAKEPGAAINIQDILVAKIINKAAGHILFYPINIPAKEINCVSLSLGPMAVLPAYQNKGIGKIYD